MKVSELQGPALDWAVAECEGLQPYTKGAEWWIRVTDPRDGSIDYCEMPQYSTDWSQGGPIIEREEISIERITSALWTATLQSGPAVSEADGPTPLIAAMRSYVASCLGDEIKLPEEL